MCDWAVATVAVMWVAGFVVEMSSPIYWRDAGYFEQLPAEPEAWIPVAAGAAILSLMYAWRKQVLGFAAVSIPLQAWWWVALVTA